MAPLYLLSVKALLSSLQGKQLLVIYSLTSTEHPWLPRFSIFGNGFPSIKCQWRPPMKAKSWGKCQRQKLSWSATKLTLWNPRICWGSGWAALFRRWEHPPLLTLVANLVAATVSNESSQWCSKIVASDHPLNHWPIPKDSRSYHVNTCQHLLFLLWHRTSNKASKSLSKSGSWSSTACLSSRNLLIATRWATSLATSETRKGQEGFFCKSPIAGVQTKPCENLR